MLETGMDHIHYFILSNTTYLLQLLILFLKLYDSSTNNQIQKIQYKNESCVQVVRTSVNELGHKTSMQKTYNSLLSSPILSMPILGCDAVLQVSGSHILKVCCHHLQVSTVREEYQTGLCSRIVFDLLKQRA